MTWKELKAQVLMGGNGMDQLFAAALSDDVAVALVCFLLLNSYL